APHRPEPDLAGDRPTRPGPAGLDADARPHRPRPDLGTPPPAAAAAAHRRTADHHRTPTHPAPPGALALDQHHHRRPGPPRSTTQPRLTSTNPPRQPQEGDHQGPWNPAHPERHPGHQPDHHQKTQAESGRYAAHSAPRKIEAKLHRQSTPFRWPHMDIRRFLPLGGFLMSL